MPTCALVCVSFHCGWWKSCLDSHWHLREWSGHPKVITPTGIHHLNKGVGAVWLSPGLLPKGRSCVGCVISASLMWLSWMSGCLFLGNWVSHATASLLDCSLGCIPCTDQISTGFMSLNSLWPVESKHWSWVVTTTSPWSSGPALNLLDK